MKPTQASIIAKTENAWNVEGELTFNTTKLLLNKSKKMLLSHSSTAESSKSTLEIDLSQVTCSDSSGLALLVEWQRLAAQHKKTIIFKNLPSQLFNMAKLSKLDNILNI
ncbi:MAG: STAS domain-containing protein [Gammaproteobacteria bacterium]|jgi:phospholipid transport system transporter-binding protein